MQIVVHPKVDHVKNWTANNIGQTTFQSGLLPLMERRKVELMSDFTPHPSGLTFTFQTSKTLEKFTHPYPSLPKKLLYSKFF